MEMEKSEFVEYEMAKRLRGLGFDEPCYAWHVSENYGLTYGRVVQSDLLRDALIAPTNSQVFRWFRDEHNLYGEILMDRTTSPKWAFEIHRYEDFGNYEKSEEKEWSLYRTYEEAEEDCLKRLCSIIELEGRAGA